MKQTITGITDYQNIAQHKLPTDVYGYYISGSDDEVTLKNNVSAFDSVYLAPRVLIDMSKLSMNTKILG
jgi:L-lactate dehydrogenase (cytochrome)